jgi:cyclic 2,3-diphosphoglycerate synthetase
MAEAGSEWETTRDAVRRVTPAGVDVVATVLRPRPAADIRGRTVAYFCTAPPAGHAVLAAHLEEVHGAVVTHVSGNLASREALHDELAGVEAEIYLIELKAAAVDVVAEFAVGRKADIVLASNDVVPLPAEGDLDEMLLEMAGIAV